VGAFAASRLWTGEDVARSLPAGAAILGGTNPSCTVMRDQVEYDCTLERAPVGEIAAGEFMGTVEPTVDATRHVSGGCRSLDQAGTHWRCYIGREAVRQQIIGADFLGASAPSPGRG
jgi:hypothetical protein